MVMQPRMKVNYFLTEQNILCRHKKEIKKDPLCMHIYCIRCQFLGQLQ
uniref:Uncharacterized protein n=1 Tax=Rhizophora mucronata TaxID=61149 RepID=A0A2P2NVL9_RHIMU